MLADFARTVASLFGVYTSVVFSIIVICCISKVLTRHIDTSGPRVKSNFKRPNTSKDHHANVTTVSQEPEAKPKTALTPISVNYHFTRKCNKECGFCFHTEKTSFVATTEDMKRGLTLLKNDGTKKINFAGGEPFLYPKQLSMLCRFAKAELNIESVSIITNGTKVTEKWLSENRDYVDILGVSCDSFNEATNIKIGRGTGDNVGQLFRIRDWCRALGIKFKLNTVVCKLNWEEDMASIVTELDPFRWKCFQVLYVEGENDATELSARMDKRKRHAKALLISDDQYQMFCNRHKHVPSFVPESNELMASSYLILDEHLRFLDKGSGKEMQSSCILEVGVEAAMKEVRWDREAFVARGGLYDWVGYSGNGSSCSSRIPSDLEF